MPRLSKGQKQEWTFFIEPKTGRRRYNELCRKCIHNCKQSFRAIIVCCPNFKAKRQKYYMANKVKNQHHINTNLSLKG
ncbi:MAG: hypothetical protein LUG21_07775 [Clostridiales bacterium]|nr:hypothetical protein [Clostridiales bacterium]